MNSGVTVSERQADYLDNELSTAQTVQEMCGLIAAAAKDPLVRAVALECRRDSRKRLGLGKARTSASRRTSPSCGAHCGGAMNSNF